MPKKILWVEDDAFLNEIIAEKLVEQGWELIPAAEGVAALALAHEKQPDIIILDILLPGMDGMEVLSKLKSDEGTKNIPIIMFSNLDDKAKIEQSKKLGAKDFYVKATTDLETIVKDIEKIIAN